MEKVADRNMRDRERKIVSIQTDTSKASHDVYK